MVLFFQRINPLSLFLLLLTVLIIILAAIARLAQVHSKNGSVYFLIILTLSILVSLTFTVNKTILFYLFFEGSLIPIFLIVIGWGYQPERLSAGFALFFYTLVASLPLLLVVINLLSNSSLTSLDILPTRGLTYTSSSLAASCLQLITIAAFLVKLPIYIVHQ